VPRGLTYFSPTVDAILSMFIYLYQSLHHHAISRYTGAQAHAGDYISGISLGCGIVREPTLTTPRLPHAMTFDAHLVRQNIIAVIANLASTSSLHRSLYVVVCAPLQASCRVPREYTLRRVALQRAASFARWRRSSSMSGSWPSALCIRASKDIATSRFLKLFLTLSRTRRSGHGRISGRSVYDAILAVGTVHTTVLRVLSGTTNLSIRRLPRLFPPYALFFICAARADTTDRRQNNPPSPRRFAALRRRRASRAFLCLAARLVVPQCATTAIFASRGAIAYRSHAKRIDACIYRLHSAIAPHNNTILNTALLYSPPFYNVALRPLTALPFSGYI